MLANASSIVVLDTNVVLDLLVFNDERSLALHQSLQNKALHWAATTAMFDELADVLARPGLAKWGHDPHSVLAAAHKLCHALVHTPANTVPVPKCADTDDQMFIDLAWRWPARWLFSRDRALLNLARPALAQGLLIAPPLAWPGGQV